MQRENRGFGEKILGLQWLRAIAALGVVLYHSEMGANVYLRGKAEVNTFAFGGFGVLLFFVLSGFVIAMSAAERPRSSRAFLLGRMARLYPAYLFTAMLFMVSLALMPKQSFNHAPVLSWVRLLRTLVFDLGQMGGYVYVGWTLFYEICFYLAFALVVSRFSSLCQQSRLMWSLAAGLLLCALLSWIHVGAFLLGVILFVLNQNIFVGKGRLVVGFSVLLVAVAAYSVKSPASLVCAALLLGLIHLERILRGPFSFPVMLWLGDASYSIYLAQVLTISASLKVAQVLSGGTRAFIPLAIVLSLLTTVLAGFAMRRWIEKPGTVIMLRWGERLLGGGVVRKD
jgi:exopolysaccharide production protein ExoZ